MTQTIQAALHGAIPPMQFGEGNPNTGRPCHIGEWLGDFPDYAYLGPLAAGEIYMCQCGALVDINHMGEKSEIHPFP